jgi:group II intron reverse transcriptase/maturase
VFTRVYRYLLREDIYYVAYQNLYSNKGAATKGVDDDTADGFGREKIAKIIKMLSDETYIPSPARRTYIQKSNGKMRPLGIPTFTDKLVQETLKMILEAVYEPTFSHCSHGFRPERSCHTALSSIKRCFAGVRWFIEGDIKGCFDNIGHVTLIEIINRKIKDARLIKLIYKFLKAGYMENWQYHKTYSGTPQGGIISPILANIYLNELDNFAMSIKADFDAPATQLRTTEYCTLRSRMNYTIAKAKKADGEEKAQLVFKAQELRKQLLKTPSKSQTDKRFQYVRYADDFLIGICGSREDCEELKRKFTEFIGQKLKMELSEEKTLITHSSQRARFLGYDVSIRRNGKIKPTGQGSTQRTLNNTVELTIPFDDNIHKFIFSKGIAIQKTKGELYPVSRPALLKLTDLEIVSTYNAELRGVCNYYNLAANFCHLNYFSYLVEYSCLKTLAAKHKSSINKIQSMYKDGKGKWGIPYQTKSGSNICYIAKHYDCRKTIVATDKIDNTERFWGTTTAFESRLNARQCELCGTTESQHYEIHHIHKVKDLKEKEMWERIMIAKRRKTIVLCKECHIKIHTRVKKEQAIMESRVHREV